QGLCLGVVVGIGMRLDACALKNGMMISPGRIADPDFTVGKGSMQKVGANLERTSPAHALNRGHTPTLQRLMIRAEHEFLYGCAIRRQAFHRQIGARLRVLRATLLGSVNRCQDRYAAGVVVVQAYR